MLVIYMDGFSKKVDMEACLRKGLHTEVALMMAFIEQQNIQLDDYTSKFSSLLENGGRGIVINEYYDHVSVSNVSSDEYDLEATFKKDLPNYVRISQVLMLWAMLEKTLSYIVKRLSEQKNIEFRGRKGESIFIYNIRWLEEIDGMPNSAPYSDVVDFLENNVRNVRNALVHGSQPDVTHKYFEVTDTETIISSNYVWEICISIDLLSRYLAHQPIAKQ